MNKNKLFAVVISLALAIAVVLPGTLAVSTDQTSSNGTVAVSAETPTPTPGTEETPTPVEEEKTAETEAPIEEPAKTCTCDPQPAEGEAHKESCPLYAAPAAPTSSSHIESCSDECTDENCKCGCHLFARIMACRTLDEIWAVIEGASDEALSALTDEQNAAIDARIKALEPEPAPAVVIEQSAEQTVPSEIYYPTVNYTRVAPFGEPVSGSHR